MIRLTTEEDTVIVGLTDSLQKLSFEQLLKELGMMKLKLGVIIPIIFEKGKEKGFNEIEIRKKVKKAIDIPERTLNRYLPEGAKQHRYPKNRELAKLANYNEITEDSTSTKASNSEPVPDVLSKSAQKSAYIYGNWTLEELVSRYEEIVLENVSLGLQLDDASTRIEELEQENVYADIQLADANTRIKELEQCLGEQGLTVYDDNDR